MHIDRILRIPFFLALFFESITFVSFPKMTTVLSNEFSVLLLIGTGLMILALLAGIHIYIPKNKQGSL